MPFAAMTTSTLAYFLVMPEPGRHSPKLRELTEALLALA
jgi:hypothetical protein